MITAITPTGDRQLTLSLCKQWMENQTVKPNQWIIVDDGKIQSEIGESGINIDYIRREPDGQKNTLAINLKAAIPNVKGNKILIIEDDEYYCPRYIEVMSHHLSHNDIVGIGMSRYYHLYSGGYMIIGNMHHASLAQTGFRKSLLNEFDKILVPGKLYIDFAIWQKAQNLKKKWFVFRDRTPLYVGMKGLPGRNGIGRGHDSSIYRTKDRGRMILRQWMPNGDYKYYFDIFEQMKRK